MEQKKKNNSYLMHSSHKYLDKRYSPRSGKYVYIYKYSEPAKRGRDKWEKDTTYDVEGSRGKNHYVYESGRVNKKHRRPKTYSPYMLAKDFQDRKTIKKQRIQDIKNGKIAKNGQVYINEKW